MARITINGVSLDPIAQAQVLNLTGLESADASASDYILIQTAAPLSSDQTEELTKLGVAVQEYVSENTYLCRYEGTDLASIRALPFVTWANVYLEGFKVAPDLRPEGVAAAALILPTTASVSHSRTARTVDIVFHEDVDPNSAAVKSAVAAAAHVDEGSLEMGRNKVRLTVEERFLDDLAAIDAVRVIEEAPIRKLRNSVARTILNAQVVVTGTTYEGDGQVIAVADTGFDTGSTTGSHPAFTGRVNRLYALGRPGPPGKSDDPHGHGTHVCGSALGDGTSASMGGAIRGTAPQAHLVMQSLIGPSGGLSGIPIDLTDLFLPPYRDDGARVHTNSWGDQNPGRPYDQSAREIDDFVWNHPDMVICFAAGNDGTDGNGDGIIDLAQVGSEAAAKNCITVGASESDRRNIERTYGSIDPVGFSKNPIHDDPMANHPEGMAAFSSRGATQEQRFKPDVVAPGTSILSARSRNAPAASNTFGTSSDSDYFFDTGTSMAAPLVAGCAAVLRETLVKNGMAAPSAALIKALLINGAVELVGQYSPSEAGVSPNNNSGFGRVNLLGSVILPGPNPDAGFGDGGPLNQGDEDVITIPIPPQPPERHDHALGSVAGIMALGATFKITLVWSDPAGVNLQNDLDLIVRAADGSERHGNMGTSSGFDLQNNVEQVFWPSMPAGDAKIIIRATRITRFPQPYAYAWRIS
jgi:serine protease AprX